MKEFYLKQHFNNFKTASYLKQVLIISKQFLNFVQINHTYGTGHFEKIHIHFNLSAEPFQCAYSGTGAVVYGAIICR